jgi:hypothetical protein
MNGLAPRWSGSCTRSSRRSPPSEITRERLSLEDAIRKVEADAARKARMEARTEPRFEPRPIKPPSRPAPRPVRDTLAALADELSARLRPEPPAPYELDLDDLGSASARAAARDTSDTYEP